MDKSMAKSTLKSSPRFKVAFLWTATANSILGKLESSLRAVRQAEHGVHEVDVRRTSVTMAAFDLGVGNTTDNLRNGSGRVVATSKSVSCTAVLVDRLHKICDPAAPCNLPPPTVASLPLLPAP